MPNETIYVPNEQYRYALGMVDGESVENISQAIQQIIDDHREGEA